MSGGGLRARETQNPKQAPGSELSAQSLMRGLNPQTVRSWPELKSDAQPTEPPRRPKDVCVSLDWWLMHIPNLLLFLLGKCSHLFCQVCHEESLWQHCVDQNLGRFLVSLLLFHYLVYFHLLQAYSLNHLFLITDLRSSWNILIFFYFLKADELW